MFKNIFIIVFIGIVVVSLIFIMCAIKISGKCSEIEERKEVEKLLERW